MSLVVKIGGAAGIGTNAPLLEDLARVAAQQSQLAIVHGGSDATNRLQEQLGAPARFLESPSGQTSRRTDRSDLEAFAMATGLINRQLVEQLLGLGVRAFGCSGLDGGLVRGQRKAVVRAVENGRTRMIRDQWTGRPQEVDTSLLGALLGAGQVPVIAPLVAGAAGEMLNTDGDRLAASLAMGLKAETLVILTNVPGLLEDPERPDSLISHVPEAELERAENFAKGRMRKKILGAREALTGGVQRVILADARVANPVSSALAGNGTVIGAELGRLIGSVG